MAIKKVQIRPEGENHPDIIHPETDSDMVVMGSGQPLSSEIVSVSDGTNVSIDIVPKGTGLVKASGYKIWHSGNMVVGTVVPATPLTGDLWIDIN
jgi:hypothetical protein